MGKNEGLGCLQKRNLLNQSAASADALLRWGSYYEENDLLNDAIEFYSKAGDKESLLRILKVVQAEGNLFLFRRICSLAHYEPTQEEWLSLARQADQNGKLAFAAESYRIAGVDTEQDQSAQIQTET